LERIQLENAIFFGEYENWSKNNDVKLDFKSIDLSTK